jgi:NADPH:quinone reductase-like Zn-dependent oxidoreductase
LTKYEASGFRIRTEYPSILGEDVAGEVEEIGERVDRFKKGDRVISYDTQHPPGSAAFADCET